jgi:antitoxin MazE
MKVKVAKWGNSLGVRLPKAAAEAAGLKPGSELEVSVEGGELRLKQLRRIPYYRLEDLLAQIKPGTEPPPFEDWGILPSEWPQDDWSDIAPTDAEWAAHRREVDKRTAERRREQTPKGEKHGAVRRRRGA